MTKRLTQQEFENKVLLKHSTKYQVVGSYSNNSTKIDINCKDHGLFSIRPQSLMSGRGCPICRYIKSSRAITSNTESFINKSLVIHGNKYDYSMTSYVDCFTDVEIICKNHGSFLQKPCNHLGGKGCKSCANMATQERCKGSIEKFLENVKLHRDYDNHDYSKVIYKRSNVKVEIICKKHGSFLVTPNNYLRTSSCPSCAENGFNQSKDGVLYIINSKNLTKIGITNREVSTRVQSINKSSKQKFSLLTKFEFEKGSEAYNIEQTLLKELRAIYKQPTEVFDGYTECFYDVNQDCLIRRIEELILDIKQGE